MYLSIISTIVSILFLIAGISGFIPGLFQDGLLFGIFQVDMIHNVLNIVIGLIALISTFRWKTDRLFFQVFGVLFGLLAIASFVWQGDLMITKVNMADTIVHAVLSVLFLVLGFSARKEGQV